MFTCTTCNLEFATLGKINTHNSIHHQASVLVTFKDGRHCTLHRQGDGTFVCTCRQTFQNAAGIRRHGRRHELAPVGEIPKGNELSDRPMAVRKAH